MDRLVLYPTSTAQWQALVSESEKKLEMNLSEELESYLVFLLMRFIKNPNILQSILATDFLLSLAQLKNEREKSIRDVGDKCLLFSGFFPGRARKCRVNISYFVKLGQTAYQFLADNHAEHDAELFEHLCQEFVGLMDILQAMHPSKLSGGNLKDYHLDLLQAEELWHDLGSKNAFKILSECTNGFVLPGMIPTSTSKH